MTNVIKEDKALGLAINPSIKLRTGQAKLYEFILEKHKSGNAINLVEVVDQYRKYGNRHMRNGVPMAYVYDWDGRHLYAPLVGNELNKWALQWFIRNLGVFVVKGLLTAVPTMNLADIQIEESN